MKKIVLKDTTTETDKKVHFELTDDAVKLRDGGGSRLSSKKKCNPKRKDKQERVLAKSKVSL